MFDLIFGTDFWASPAAMWGVGILVALLILRWDWRLFLPGLVLTQYGLGQILIHRYGVPSQWLLIYLLVTLLSGLILALSPLQTERYAPEQSSGNFFFRGALLVLLLAFVYSVSLELLLPILDAATVRLLLWLLACSLLTLALTDRAVFTGAGLLLWLLPVQSVMAIIVPQPALIALLGMLMILIALACAYLAVAESEALLDHQLPPTEIVFPEQPVSTHSIPVQARLLRRFLLRRLSAVTELIKRSQG